MQQRFLKARLAVDLRDGAAVLPQVTVSTVDAFQGREADVVLFSAVRAPRPGHAAGGGGHTAGVGFLADVRRMNVALTRARRSLLVVGHAETLARSRPWRKLLEHCAERRALVAAAPSYSAALQRMAPSKWPPAANRAAPG